VAFGRVAGVGGAAVVTFSDSSATRPEPHPATIRCGSCRQIFRAQWAGPGQVVTCVRCGKKNRMPQGVGTAAGTSEEEVKRPDEYNSRVMPQAGGAPVERNFPVIPEDVKIQVAIPDQGRHKTPPGNPATIRCGSCRQKFRAQWAGPGQVVTCVRCGKKNRIPQGVGIAAATSDEQAKRPGKYNSRVIPQVSGAPVQRNFPVIPQDVRIQVAVRDQSRCVQCGSVEDLHYVHKIPWGRGGNNTVNNIQLLCGPCNR
jgi:RNase P subunit RPR2